MSSRAKGFLMRLLERLVDGPKCPNCPHDAAIHTEDMCLGAIHDYSKHVGWCTCTSTKRERAHAER